MYCDQNRWTSDQVFPTDFSNLKKRNTHHLHVTSASPVLKNKTSNKYLRRSKNKLSENKVIQESTQRITHMCLRV